MTLQEIRESDKTFLFPEDIAEVLGCKPYSINLQAKDDPTKLGFAVTLIGTRVRIPRDAFIHWMQYGNSPVQEARNAIQDQRFVPQVLPRG